MIFENDFADFARQMHQAELRASAFGGSNALCGCTLEKDNGSVPQMRMVRDYIDHWQEMREQGLGLLLYGPPGGGKTFAAAAIANALMEKDVTVRMGTLGEILSRLPALSPQDKLTYLDELKSCGALILDDFGMERRTDYAREQIFSIVDGRYLSKGPMIVTTNLTLEELKNPPDLGSRRIFDRVLENCVPLNFNSPSLRRDRAKENLKRYRQITGV